MQPKVLDPKIHVSKPENEASERKGGSLRVCDEVRGGRGNRWLSPLPPGDAEEQKAGRSKQEARCWERIRRQQRHGPSGTVLMAPSLKPKKPDLRGKWQIWSRL